MCKKCKQKKDSNGKVWLMLDVIPYKDKEKQVFQIDRFIIIEKELSYTKNGTNTKTSYNKRKNPSNKSAKAPATKPSKKVKIEQRTSVKQKNNSNQTSTLHYNEEVKDTQKTIPRTPYTYMGNSYSYLYIK